MQGKLTIGTDLIQPDQYSTIGDETCDRIIGTKRLASEIESFFRFGMRFLTLEALQITWDAVSPALI